MQPNIVTQFVFMRRDWLRRFTRPSLHRAQWFTLRKCARLRKILQQGLESESRNQKVLLLILDVQQR